LSEVAQRAATPAAERFTAWTDAFVIPALA
jgi:hypothetical protein